MSTFWRNFCIVFLLCFLVSCKSQSQVSKETRALLGVLISEAVKAESPEPDSAPQPPHYASEGIEPGSDTFPELVKAQNLFSLDIYQALVNYDENLFISPFSIWSSVCMAYSGAADLTRDEMGKVLQLPNELNLGPALGAMTKQIKATADRSKIDLNIANALFSEEKAFFSLKQPFVEDITENYLCEHFLCSPSTSPVQAAGEVNSWVAKQTNNNIKEIVTPELFITEDPDNTTSLVLANAIYFYGDWQKRFSKNSTEDDKFYTAEDEFVTLPLMRQKSHFPYYENESIQAIRMPYGKKGDGTFSMVVILPREREGLREVVESLELKSLENCISSMNSKEVQLFLPRFKLEKKYDLISILSELGMTSAFIEKEADFSNMIEFKGIGQEENYVYLKDVIHKTGIEVSEKGTEAYAATVIRARIGYAGALPAIPIIFRADHPFLFLIRDDVTGAILFLGHFVGK